jgi:histidinol-phosphatase (PHP family)
MLRSDNHSHIILADIKDMVAAAKARKVDRYSITEHVSQFREMKESVDFGSTHGEGRIFEDLKEYRREFARVDEPALAGMKLRKGLEVDFSPRYEARVGAFVNQEKWDVLLCSVHELGDRADIEHPRKKPIDPVEADKLWHEYFGLEQAALESDFVPFSVLTHPTRMIKGVSRLPDDLDDLLLDLARTAKRRNKALELNGKDIGYAPELVRRVAKACSRAGCTVSLGSDSHYPQDVFRNMDIATAMLEEFGLQLG